MWPTLVVTLVCVGCLVAALVGMPHSVPTSPPPEPSAEPSLVARIIGYVLLGLMVILAVRVAAWAALSVLEHRARVRQAELEARQMHRDPNGMAPLVMADNGAVVDPDTAPGGVVNGIRGRRNAPEMPEPATPAHERQVERAAMTRLAVGAGARGLAALPRQQETPRMPPRLHRDDVPEEMSLLMDAAKAEYRLLPEGGYEQSDDPA